MAPKSSSTSDRELVITRLLDAPATLVFDAFTKPEHVSHWWGPHGFSTTISEMDVRPGGVWRLVMHGPDGRDYKNRIIFLEVDRPHRLVYKHDPEPGTEPGTMEVSVTFATEGNQTRLTMRMLFPSAANRDYMFKTYGVEEGGKQTFQRLASFLIATSPTAPKPLVLTRVINAPRDLVFQAWIDPKQLSQWWGPSGYTSPVCEVDPRVGGKFLIHMQGPDGKVKPMYGALSKIDASERLIFITGMTEPDGTTIVEIQNTVTFIDDGNGKTVLTLEAQVLIASEAARPMVAGMEMGWSQSLERLATLFRTGRQTL